MWPGSWEWEREICLAELPQLSRESSAARHLAKRSADALNDYRIRKCGGCLSRRFVSSFPCHRHHRRLSLSAIGIRAIHHAQRWQIHIRFGRVQYCRNPHAARTSLCSSYSISSTATSILGLAKSDRTRRNLPLLGAPNTVGSVPTRTVRCAWTQE